jgi:hypothetical protein
MQNSHFQNLDLHIFTLLAHTHDLDYDFQKILGQKIKVELWIRKYTLSISYVVFKL